MSGINLDDWVITHKDGYKLKIKQNGRLIAVSRVDRRKFEIPGYVDVQTIYLDPSLRNFGWADHFIPLIIKQKSEIPVMPTIKEEFSNLGLF